MMKSRSITTTLAPRNSGLIPDENSIVDKIGSAPNYINVLGGIREEMFHMHLQSVWTLLFFFFFFLTTGKSARGSGTGTGTN